MFKNKFNSSSEISKNKTKKILLFLLSGFISLIPIVTITACNKNNKVIEKSDIDKNFKILNNIKSVINNQFNQNESSVLDYKSFAGLSESALFQILENYYKSISNTNNIKINNSKIIEYFINKSYQQLGIMNIKLKNEIIQLSNLPFDIVSLSANNLFLEKLSYEQIINVIKNLGQDTNYNYDNSPTPKIFKLKLNLTFKIRIDNVREEEYVFPELQHFITDNINDVFGKLSNISDLLYLKLQDSKVSLEKILNKQSDLDENLNQNAIKAIKSSFNTKIPKLILNFNRLSTPIKAEDLRMSLKSLKHTNSDGVSANYDGIKYYQNFIKTIITSDQNMIQSIYSNNNELKKINGGNLPSVGSVNINSISFIPLNLSINDIKIPMIKPIKVYLTLEYNTFLNYLKEFRAILDEYFTLIKAGEVEFIGDSSRKVVEVYYDLMGINWKTEPVKVLEEDFIIARRRQMKSKNIYSFKMHFYGPNSLKDWDNGLHSGNVTVKFIFKVFTINFLDNEQIRFKYRWQ